MVSIKEKIDIKINVGKWKYKIWVDVYGPNGKKEKPIKTIFNPGNKITEVYEICRGKKYTIKRMIEKKGKIHKGTKVIILLKSELKTLEKKGLTPKFYK